MRPMRQTLLIVDDHPGFRLLARRLLEAGGFEVTARLAAGEVATVVVLTSTRDRGDYGERVIQSGARGFIPKAELSGAALHALLEATG
jgi:two-component system chemotaxis response regulator CheY